MLNELEPLLQIETINHSTKIESISLNETQVLLPETPRNSIDSLFDLNSNADNTKKRRILLLETWEHVFLPSIFGFWGLLVYARYGFILGQLGVCGVGLIILVTYTLIALTSSSVAAICSNGACFGSGPYYLISRSLGPEFGGSIGVLRTAGNLVTVILSLVGVSELACSALELNTLYTATALNIILGFSVLIKNSYSSGLNNAFAITVVGAAVWIGSTLLSIKHVGNSTSGISIGWTQQNFFENLWPQELPSFDVWVKSTALFFPCSSGLLSGTSALHRLRVPGTSVANGLGYSLVATLVLYLVTTIFFAGCFSKDDLQSDNSILLTVAFVPVAASIVGLSLQSALNSLSSAIMMLQNMIHDNLVSMKFGSRKIQIAVICTLTTELGLIFTKNLETAALVVTMFTLITFCAMNLACFLLKIASAPNFRPLAPWFSWKTSLIGFFLAFALMFAISNFYAILSLAAFIVFFTVFHYAANPQQWGDVTQALIYHQVRKYLLHLNGQQHIKLWRPQILLLVQNPASSYWLIKFINDLKKGSLFVVGHIKLGLFDKHAQHYERDMLLWEKLLRECKIKAFPQISISENLRQGVQHLVTTVGLGGLRPNLVIIGDMSLVDSAHSLSVQQVATEFLNDPEYETLSNSQLKKYSAQDYVGLIEDILSVNKAVGIAKGFRNFEKFMYGNPVRFADNANSSGDVKERLRFNNLTESNSCKGTHLKHRNTNKLRLPRYSLFTRLRWKNTDEHERKPFIDVWPICYDSLKQIRESDNAYSTNGWLSSSFNAKTLPLQLGCILNMVPYWKTHFNLRVLSFVEDPSDAKLEYIHLKSLLETLRIEAQICVVSLLSQINALKPAKISHKCKAFASSETSKGIWLDNDFFLSCGGSGTFSKICKQKQYTTQRNEAGSLVFPQLPFRLQCEIIGELFCRYSSEDRTRLCITTLPTPEPCSSSSQEHASLYLSNFNLLSQNNIPTLFVYGKNESISTTV